MTHDSLLHLTAILRGMVYIILVCQGEQKLHTVSARDLELVPFRLTLPGVSLKGSTPGFCFVFTDLGCY